MIAMDPFPRTMHINIHTKGVFVDSLILVHVSWELLCDLEEHIV